MSSHDGVRNVSVIAGEDLTGDLYKLAVINASGQAVKNTVAQGAVDGVIAEEVDAAGKVTSILIPNGAIAEVKAGGTVTAGDLVASDANAQAIAWVDAVGNNAIGRALDSAVSGDVFRVLFSLKDVGAGT